MWRKRLLIALEKWACCALSAVWVAPVLEEAVGPVPCCSDLPSWKLKYLSKKASSNAVLTAVWLRCPQSRRPHCVWQQRRKMIWQSTQPFEPRHPGSQVKCRCVKASSVHLVSRTSGPASADGRSWSFSRLEVAYWPSAQTLDTLIWLFAKTDDTILKTLITLWGAFCCFCHYSAIILMPRRTLEDCSMR